MELVRGFSTSIHQFSVSKQSTLYLEKIHLEGLGDMHEVK